jgi:acyl-CoA thioesterase
MADLDRIRAYFTNDRYAAHAGIELVDIAPDRATARMPVTETHWNSLRGIHGGAVFTLADFAFAAAANTCGKATVAINASASFFRSVSGGTLTATAEAVHRGRRISYFLVTVRDEEETIIASFQGMAYTLDKPFPPDEDAEGA